MTNQTQVQHTPGPWELVNQYEIWGPAEEAHRPLGKFLASTNVHGMGQTDPYDVLRANARLIAAAPDLLAALQDVSRAYQEMFDVMPVAWQTYDDIVQEAIRTATAS